MRIPSFIFLVAAALLGACATDVMSGKRTMALIPESQMNSMASQQFAQVKKENKIVKGTPDAQMIDRVGWKLVRAAEKWVAAQGSPNHFRNYKWEFILIEDKSINAWAMPGGRIAFYTGILPVTQNEAGIAVVMGHEIAHAILNHGQQRMSAGLLQQAGLASASIALGGTSMSPEMQSLTMTAFGVGSNVFGTLPFSRRHEDEADLLGLKLMAIAGYDPAEAVAFWERMSALSRGGGGPAWLSTHPSHAGRIRNLQNSIPKAKQAAVQFGI
ncbi:MAG: M48 family metallopeptidase [Alphaproteobacteria bacterium]|nr:M48 family metallopeptidase [Alphaproteobacteria bacterium]